MGNTLCSLCARQCSPEATARCLAAPKLNLGSGEMLLPDWINFDMTRFTRGALSTDILGRIEDITQIFKPQSFQSILSAHVIEHFRPPAGRKMIIDCFELLRPGGTLIVEGPDVIGVYETCKGKEEEIIRHLFGCQPHCDRWGGQWAHRWGYTKKTAAKLLAECGFTIKEIGIGLTHGMGARDFRVVGVRP